MLLLLLLLYLQALPAPARSLLLRLLLRKRRWYQLSALSYSDVSDIPAAAHQLSGVGLISWCTESDADLNSLLPELPVVLLKAVLAKVLPRNHPAIMTGAAAGGVEGKAALVSSIQVRGRGSWLGGLWLMDSLLLCCCHCCLTAACCISLSPASGQQPHGRCFCGVTGIMTAHDDINWHHADEKSHSSRQ